MKLSLDHHKLASCDAETPPLSTSEVIDKFRDVIRSHGLEPPEAIEPGKWHRFPGIGKRNGNTAGWCKLFDDGLGGCFGDLSSGFSENWQAKREKPFSQSERAAFMRRGEEARKHAEAERQQQYADAAKKAAPIWNAATTANDDHRSIRLTQTYP